MEAISIIFWGGLLLWVWFTLYDLKKKGEVHLDKRGYARDGYGKLHHRNIAYNQIYKEGYANGKYRKRFGEYDIHHIDHNKQNNHPDNLQILTREDHKEIHGFW